MTSKTPKNVVQISGKGQKNQTKIAQITLKPGQCLEFECSKHLNVKLLIVQFTNGSRFWVSGTIWILPASAKNNRISIHWRSQLQTLVFEWLKPFRLSNVLVFKPWSEQRTKSRLFRSTSEYWTVTVHLNTGQFCPLFRCHQNTGLLL